MQLPPQIQELEQAKRDSSVYPGQAITLLQIETANGAKETAWVNKAYKGYKFKECCPYHVIVHINLSDPELTENKEFDMRTIEDFFDDKLRSIGASHFIGRFVTATVWIFCFILKQIRGSKKRLQY